MYAIIATFDDDFSNQIREIWRDLEVKNISAYASQVENRKPHLTLASYHEISRLDDFQSQLTKFCQNSQKLTLQFSSVGSFLQSEALFLIPVVTETLISFHKLLHEKVQHYVKDSSSFYQPEHWIPHVTLANYLGEAKRQEAFAYCQQKIGLQARLKALDVISISPNKQVETLFTIPLG